MIKGNKRIGIDVGGSHVSVSVIDMSNKGQQVLSMRRKDIDSFGTANEILETIGTCIKECVVEEKDIAAVGLAFPGPFDYQKGVSAITGVGGKFASTFGIHVQHALKSITGLYHVPFAFTNDAHCFAVGAYDRHQLKSKRTVFLTLGTGFGSAFMADGKLLHLHPLLPATGTFYDQKFLKAAAEDYISTRWFFNEYKCRTGADIVSVKQLAESNSPVACSIFEQFGSNLGMFLLPWLNKFACDELIIGGNIARANHLFSCSLIQQLQQTNFPVTVTYCDDTEESILTGAALLVQDNMDSRGIVEQQRKTTQALLPLTAGTNNKFAYDIYPYSRSAYPVYKGFDVLAEKISEEKIVIIDGFQGVLWELFVTHLQQALYAKNKKVFWYDINTCMHHADMINELIADNLNGDDPVFGKKYTGELIDFFDKEKLKLLTPDINADICIVYGTGATLSNWNGTLVYLDVPKNEIQYRMRAGSVTNIGADTIAAYPQMYKRCYFVDWPVLNKYKEQLLSKINCIADEQRITEITLMDGDDFRNTLEEMLEQPLRARPWFEAGVWGGNWMKKHINGLNNEEVNYAWSFELITPENGIVIEGNSYLLEVSFDFLLFRNNTKLLGKAAKRFGNEFPIRFDFLDTYDGGNLSVQCHPRTEYIHEKFGESFTQDETYYILDCEPDAKVYLGFQENINADEFKTALLNAQERGEEMEVEKFVQQHDAQKHDLFLIPNGTVHASGKNNMVLEISNTPYIFTFKMYDWARLDLNGQPRPINIAHAFNNLHFEYKGNYVQQHLISQPRVTAEWKGGRRVQLPTHVEHFYTVDRYEFNGEIQISTHAQCHVCMLVEGEEIEVIVADKTNTFSYAETFIVPASVRDYHVSYKGTGKAYLVVAYVKDDCC